ncbi:MAG: PilZ domain-containing protein [Lachnospiraceae bacterium]|nr:PilZ domain-containing protein [Lachnospiraceae bacterium]
MGQEKRRNRRVPIRMDLEVSSIFKQDNVLVKDLNAPIEIIDISADGIGFNSKSEIPVGYYFNARLIFSEIESVHNSLNCVVKIIRARDLEDGVRNYGCEFVGMSSVFEYIFRGIEEKYPEEKKIEA